MTPPAPGRIARRNRPDGLLPKGPGGVDISGAEC